MRIRKPLYKENVFHPFMSILLNETEIERMRKYLMKKGKNNTREKLKRNQQLKESQQDKEKKKEVENTEVEKKDIGIEVKLGEELFELDLYAPSLLNPEEDEFFKYNNTPFSREFLDYKLQDPFFEDSNNNSTF